MTTADDAQATMTPSPQDILMAFFDPREVALRLLQPDASERILLAGFGLEVRHRCRAAMHPNATRAVLERAAKDPIRDVRMEIASRDDLDLDLMRLLVNDRSKHVRINLTRNPSLPIEVRDELARDRSPMVRFQVADAPLSPRAVAQMTRDRNVWVLQRVASRDDLTPAQIERLSRHRHPDIRRKIAMHSDDSELLDRLSHDASAGVVTAVVANTATPEHSLIRLLNRTELSIRDALAARCDEYASLGAVLAHDEDWSIRRHVATNCRSGEVLATFINDRDLRVRSAMACNEHSSPDDLAQLLCGRSLAVASLAVQNPSTPLEAIDRFQASPQRAAREAARKRLNACRRPVALPCSDPKGPLEALLHWVDTVTDQLDMVTAIANPEMPALAAEPLAERLNDPDALRRAAESSHPKVRIAVVKNPWTDTETLAHLSTDPVSRVRLGVASHMNTNDDTLKALRRDSVAEVVNQAKYQLRNPHQRKYAQDRHGRRR